MTLSGLRQAARSHLSMLLASAAAAFPVHALAGSTGFINDARAVLPQAALAGRASAAKSISLTITMPSRDPEGLASFVSHVSQPGDALYRHYLTPAQFASRYGANAGDYRAIVAWAKSHSLQTGEEYSAHTALSVRGKVADLEAAFGITFLTYDRVGGSSFYNASGTPHLPAALASKVASILGFNNIALAQPLFRRLPYGAAPLAGSGPLGGYSASDIRTAYVVPPAPTGVVGETIAVFEAGGFEQKRHHDLSCGERSAETFRGRSQGQWLWRRHR